MRGQINKLVKEKSTKSERRFLEMLKEMHIPFKTKVKIKGREVDFLIGKYAVDIDCHVQASGKNEMLVAEGYTPIHLSNNEAGVEVYVRQLLKVIKNNAN
jgi:hypothetical protein